MLHTFQTVPLTELWIHLVINICSRAKKVWWHTRITNYAGHTVKTSKTKNWDEIFGAVTLPSTSMALALNWKRIRWIRCVLRELENGENQQKAWSSNVSRKGKKRGASVPNSWLAFHMERVCFFASNILVQSLAWSSEVLYAPRSRQHSLQVTEKTNAF